MRYLLVSFFLLTNLFASKILILNSYRMSLDWTHQQVDTIISNLKDSNISNITIYTEFMDTKIFRPTKQTQQNYINFFKHKYKNITFDIIITTDDNALEFIQKYKTIKIFKKAKVFFCGVNNLSLYNTLDHHIYTGVFEKKYPLGNLKLALQINPKLKTIYLISDDTATSKKLIKEYKEAFKDIKNINFKYISARDFQDIVSKLKNYDKNSIAMLLAFTSIYDKNKYLTIKEFNDKFIQIYRNPILVHTSNYINMKNVVGGNCVSGKQQATIVTKKVIKYLNKTPIDKIKIDLHSPNLYYINVKNLNSFGIKLNKIDIKNLYLKNKPTNFYELYSNWIDISIIIILIIFIFIIIIVNRNITLNKTSKQLQENLNRFEILLNSSLEGIIIFNNDYICININDKGCEIFKIETKEDAIGLNLFDFITDSSKELVLTNIDKNFTKPYEISLYRTDKTIYPALIQITEAILDNQKVKIISILDISNIKEKEQMLLQHLRLAQMGEMLGMIAHQWRQPLGAITARVANLRVKLMLKKEISPTIMQNELLKINQYAQYLSATIDDFRNFFKAHKKKTQTSCDILVLKTLPIIEESLKSKNITIIKQLNSAKEFFTYENEIKQVLLNILKNAEDILIENKITNPTITIITKENKIIIKDNGKGVPKDIISKIFEPYFSTKHKKDGTGLGLYMSKTIIEDHCQGKLTVENEKDIGAIFTIEL